ncbi:MAG TPA: TonB-dependent receptor plug domain-containing protein [Opitutaceae bacterium]|nr:TonB-dependent receptor plug domain-containing protein [Opitutaceae bacterium]
MNHRILCGWRRLFGVAVGLAVTASLPAQTTAGTTGEAPSTPSSSNNEEVLTLPEFGVTAKAGETYVPTEDAASARIKTPLKQLPYAVSTLNSEFFEDFGIFDLTDEMNFIPSLQGSDLSGGQTLRGFSGNNTQLRNGFAALGTRTRNGLEKISVIKGPAAMIYGQTSPGGTVFIDTARPTTHPYQKIEETLGSYGVNQTVAAVSGPVPIGANPTLFYRVDVEDYHRAFIDKVNTNLTREWLLTLMYKPSANTDVLFDGGYQISQQNPAQALPYLMSGTHFIGWAWQIKQHYYSTPADYRTRQRNTAEIIFEHRFTDWLSFRAGANVYKYPNYTISSGYNGQYDPIAKPNLISRSATLSWSEFTGFGESYTGEFLANYHTGPVRHTTLLTFDYYNNIRRNERNMTSKTTAQGGFSYPTSVSVIAPPLYAAPPVNSFYFVTANPSPPQVPSMDSLGHTVAKAASGTGGPSFSKLNESVPSTGFDLAHVAFFFNDKLMLTAAFRHDYYQVYAKDDYWGITSKVHGNNDAIESGASYAVTKEINVYADETEGFLPPGTSTTMYTDVPKSNSVGYEAGLKGTLLDNQLNFTADVFKVRQHNVSESVFDPVSGLTTTQYIGGVASQGFETDLNWRASERAFVYAAYQYLDTHLVGQVSPGSSGNNLVNKWGRQSGTPRHSFASTFRYEVFAGFSANARMRYNSDAPVNTQNSNSALASGQALVYSPAFVVWDLGLQYKFKTTRYLHLSHGVSFWVKNIFNKQYIIPGGDRYLGDPVGFYISYSLEH